MRDLYELISDKLDGTLDKDGQAELELRLSSDPEAREAWELLSAAHESLDFEAEPPKELLQGVMEGVERVNRERRSVGRRVIRITAGFAAAAAVLAVAVIPTAVRGKDPGGVSPYSTDPDLAREYRDNIPDGSHGSASCYNPDATDENASVCIVPPETDDLFTAEIFCADYYAVAYFDELPEALKSSDPVIFSDGTTGCVITAGQFEQYGDDARRIIYPNPDGILIMAVETGE